MGLWVINILLICTLLVGCSATTTVSEQQDSEAETFKPASGFGNVYIVREWTIAGSAIGIRLNVDGQFIGNINIGKYHLLQLKPGRYTITAYTGGGEDHEVVDVVEGENYFIQVEPVPGFRVKASAESVNAGLGRELVIKGKRLQTLPLKHATQVVEEAPKIDFPGQSVASDVLKQDILNFISILVIASGCQSFKIVNAKIVGLEGEFNVDDRNRLLSGEVNEVWTADQCGNKKDYYIKLKPDGQGGTHFSVSDSPPR